MEQKKTQTGSTVKVKERVMEPRQYLVVIHNDDVTTMDFVVMILMKYFRKSEHDAQVIISPKPKHCKPQKKPVTMVFHSY